VQTENWRNLVDMFFRRAATLGDRPFLWERHNKAYEATSWREAAANVKALASALRQYGLEDGDRVVILAHNSVAWVVADFAVMAAGGVSVPVYTTNTPDNHAHILGDSGAAFAIVSTAPLAEPLLKAAKKSKLRRIISVEPLPETDAAPVTMWDEALAEGAAHPDDVDARVRGIDAAALACLIYTSGTGGAPKGVMLSHRSILTNCAGAEDVLKDLGLEDNVFLSFLPLSHAYEHSAGLMFPVSIGAEIYFAERIDTLSVDLLEAQPTIMTAVPRLYEVMRSRILVGVHQQSRLRAKLFWTAVNLGRKRYEEPDMLTFWEKVVDRIVDKLVRDKVRARFGGRLKALVSGGAPLNYDVGVFFTGLGLLIPQGYGQTEAAPFISCNRCARVKMRMVGPALIGVDLRIADDGEILVRGDCLMDGYWNLPDLSAKTIRNGWLHTGDVGVIDADGYLQITDRKKDIIVNSGGDNISPQYVEGVLALEAEIALVVVMGDNRPHLVAVIAPSAEFISKWTEQNDREKDLGALARDKDFHHAMSEAVSRANATLPVNQQIKRFVIADRELTVENGLMTPTMKPKRFEVEKVWGAELAGLYR